jgi:hypothetical protein
VHVPRISEHDDTPLHEISQILDCRAGAAAVARTRANTVSYLTVKDPDRGEILVCGKKFSVGTW